ncbi:MAG: pyridoxamine 5'-phosphate oxidase family protein [Acidimicrobiia bacterium]|jgi:nitroimidazol reductase NimA-like FMN-containing flavoprotein (pyridoxamine 5'-phosphate oxidase superfamily)
MHEISREEALAVLDEVPVVHLGTVDDGLPYVTPMSFVVEDEAIFLRTVAGKKLDALKENPKVCLEASRYDSGTGDWESVIIRGTASVIEDAQVKERTVSLLFSKYEQVMGSPLSRPGRPQLDASRVHVVQVSFDEVTGMTSGKGFAARTRPGRL